MFGKETIGEKSLFVLAVLVAALFVVSFATAAFADENIATLNGRIVAVDSYTKTLTVKSAGDSGPSDMMVKGLFTFSTNDATNITSCEMNRSFDFLGIGERVSVKYHKMGETLVADAVDVAPLALACYDE